MPYAHSRNSLGQRHDLVAHLSQVAQLCADFASAFDAQELGRLLGLVHDAGKFHPAFQAYLLACEANPQKHARGPDHKAAGVLLASQLGLFSLALQGHHGGLHTPAELKAWLASCRDAAAPAVALARSALPTLQTPSAPPLPRSLGVDRLTSEMLLRFLFSALVDADCLDTERHFATEKAEARGAEVPLSELWRRCAEAQAALSGHRDDTVGRVRHEVYGACLAAAEAAPGLFRLTVPTGGGKTCSAMAFALRHALLHGLRRVVVAVPYISITEQTADVYRGMLETEGDAQPVVLEHHSGASEQWADEDDEDPARVWARLAADNWDTPVVVTTTAQLFESLFAAKPGRARKIHRLARSVIILDEAQAMPSHLLQPLLHVLRELCAHYGSTVVFSTATQPAFDAIPLFAGVPAREIVPEPERHFAALRRVRYEWHTEPALTWEEVAHLARTERQCLCILNTKADALALLAALEDPEALHLSTLLCGAHRRQVLAKVRRRLAAGEPCRLASTQVVEAGVDLDFPLVLRALGPLDSIIQAAGRCNREGRLAAGRVVVFTPRDGGIPGGAYKVGLGVTGAMLGSGPLDPDDPASARAYFRRLFATVDTDREGIQQLRASFDYPEVARRLRLIDDATESVVVHFGTDEQQAYVSQLIESLRSGTANPRRALRRLQPFLVNLYRAQAQRYARLGFITPILPGLGEWHGQYDDKVRGLIAADRAPDAFVI